ncbi:hypothetical protein Hanom_Chr12g01079381 [Helianthus anomalus]
MSYPPLHTPPKATTPSTATNLAGETTSAAVEGGRNPNVTSVAAHLSHFAGLSLGNAEVSRL